VIIYVLKYLDVDITPLLTSVGILGVAIGFGAQQLIRDFLAGIFITIEDQYGIGDVIETSEVVGTVESVGLRITRVRANDGAIWYLRNGEILRVGNRSQGDYVPEAASESEETKEALPEPTEQSAPKQPQAVSAAASPGPGEPAALHPQRAEAVPPAARNPAAKHPDQKASE
jgi:small conductance mechanosensitive channel